MSQQNSFGHLMGQPKPAAQADTVIAPPDPYKQQSQANDQTRLQLEQIRVDIAADKATREAEKAELELKQQREKEAKLENARLAAIGDLRRVIDKIDNVALDAADNEGWFETGFTGSIMSPFKGTAAFDLRANIETIDANSAFNRLQQMRDGSPSGGALGQVTERELDLLKSSVANLDPSQSQGQFITNLTEAKRAYLDMLERVDPEAASEYAEKPGIRFDEDGKGYLTTVSGPETREPQDPLGFDKQSEDRDDDGVLFKGVPLLEGNYSPEVLAKGLGESFGEIAEGLGDTLGIVTNPIGQTIYDATGYGDQAYDTGRILREGAGLPESPDSIGKSARQLAAGALTMGGVARGVSAALQPGVAQNALQIVGRTPIRDTAAGAGAGAGSHIGEEIGGTPGQVAGLLAGGVGGYAAANSLARNVAGSTPNALAQAAQRQNVELLPADAGGAATKAVTTGTKASPFSVAPVAKQAKKQQDQFSQAVRRAAKSQGEVVTTDAAGRTVQDAAKRYTKQTAERGARMYDRAANRAKGVKSIKPTKTIEAIDAALARLEQNPAAEKSMVDALRTFRSKVEGGVSIQGLRDARTSLSQGVYNGQLRSNADQKIWKDVLSNVSSDIDEGLRSVGQDAAADMFQTADKFWSERVEYIDQVLQPLVGRDGLKSGEDVLKAVESMARGSQGGNARLSRLLAGMTDQEAGNVRATIVDRLGRSSPGTQDAQGEAFSAAQFLTNWNKMTPQAKSSLFSNRQLRSDLNDLATLAESSKASQAFANHSNTGVAIGANAAAGTALALAHPALAAAGVGASFITGKLMASPGFARLLARTSKMPPEAANRVLTEQLGVLATRQPLIASDARALQQHLQQSFGQPSAARAVASEEEDNLRGEPPRP